MTCSLVIKADLSWILHANGHHVDPQRIPPLVDIPPLLDVTAATSLLHSLSILNICVGNPDPRYTDLCKSKKSCRFVSPTNEVVAYLETVFSFSIDDQIYLSTIRTTSCHLLSAEIRCCVCCKYRSNLVAMAYRWEKRTKDRNIKTNYQYTKVC